MTALFGLRPHIAHVCSLFCCCALCVYVECSLQLGLGASVKRQLLPTEMPTSQLHGRFGLVLRVAAGNNHSAAIASDGALLLWGANESGQLGRPGDAVQFDPIVLQRRGLCGRRADEVVCGPYFTLVLGGMFLV